MIKIDKITDKDLINNLVKKYSLTIPNGNFILGITEQSELLEFVQYSMESDHINIKYISQISNDFCLYDALMKTLIFYADLSKLRYIKTDSNHSDFVSKMKFDLVQGEYIFDIYDMDKQKCKCEKEV